MLTAYDYPTAKLLDEAGIPLLLVGDSLGRAMLGYENELQRVDGRHAPPRRGRDPRRAPRARRRRHAVPVVRDARGRAPRTPAGSSTTRAPRPSRSRAASAAPGSSRRSSRPGSRSWATSADARSRPTRSASSGSRARAASRRGRCSTTRSRSRRRAPSRSSSSSSRSSSRRRSPSASGSRRSGSAPGPAAAARSRSSPTCSASRRGSRSTPSRTPNLRETILGAVAGLRGGRRRGHVPGPGADGPDGRRVLDEVLGRSTLDASTGGPRRHARRRDPARPRPLVLGTGRG